MTSLKDFTTSLVTQIPDAFRRFSIMKLQSTYTALPLYTVTQRTSPDPNDHAETGRYIQSLIALGHLNATLSQPNENPRSWILRFATSSVSGPQARSEQQMYDELRQEMARITKLGQHIRNSNRKLTLSKEYIEVLKHAMNTGTAEGDGNESFPGYGLGDEMDEDIAADS